MAEAIHKPIRILLVEDERHVCDIYQQTLINCDRMELVCVTGSEQEAIDFVDRETVDVIILDLELLEGDGLSFIFHLEEQTRKGESKPLVIVVTNNSSVITWETAKACGADYVIPKMTREYSPIAVLSKIEKVYPFYNKNIKQSVSDKPIYGLGESSEYAREHIRQYIENMGFIAPKQGVKYMVEAIGQTMEWKGPGDLHLSNDVYPVIARKYHVTEASVEKEIRFTIRRGWSGIDEEKREKYYPYKVKNGRKRPTNTELILNLAELLKA